jgi:dephospho-CoA kinase
LIVSLSGKIGSGKSTAANYLERAYGLQVLSTKRFLLAVLKANGKLGTRSNLQKQGAAVIRAAGGGGFVAMMLEYLPKGNYLIDAIRHVDAISYLRNRYGKDYVHIHLELNNTTRRSRVLGSGNSEPSLAKLKTAERASTERGNDVMMRAADFVVNNDGSTSSLEVALDDICKKIGLKKSQLDQPAVSTV